MESLAKAIVDSANLFGQALVHLSSNQNGLDPVHQANMTSTIVYILGNLTSFLAQLSFEIAKLIQ